MKLLPSILGGLAGAVTITLLHEVLKKTDSEAPRLDKLGMQAMSQGLEATDTAVPPKKELFWLAMGADLLASTLYYSLSGIGKRKNAEGKGSTLGIIAGLAMVFLPKPMGLNDRHSNKTFKTQALTMGLYLLGGYISSMVSKALDKKQEKEALYESPKAVFEKPKELLLA